MRVYIFSPVPYAHLHQRPQKIAERLHAEGVPVTYIEVSGIRDALSSGTGGFLVKAGKSLVYHFKGVLFPGLRRKPHPVSEAGRESIQVVPLPLVIPANRYGSEFVERLNASVLRQFLRREVWRSMPEAEEAVALVQHPFWGRVLEKGDFTRIYYDCIDEISLFAGLSSIERFSQYALQLCRMSDSVFVTATKLESHLKELGCGTAMYHVPNGVDYEWFQQKAGSSEIPDDIRSIRGPIAGYVGSIYGWLDFDMIAETARRRSDISFVFVGPLEHPGRRAELERATNVHWLGRKPYAEMPLYIKAFDVCLIPFRSGRVAETTNPVKLFEYFALGKPVITTRVADLEPFEDLLHVVSNPEEFAEALDRSLRPDGESVHERRREVARAHSWKTQVDRMMKIMRL